MTAYLSITVKRARTRSCWSAKSALVVNGKTVASMDTGPIHEGPNWALWKALSPVNWSAKQQGLVGDIKPEHLKRETRQYRRVYRHDGQGWVMTEKESTPK